MGGSIRKVRWSKHELAELARQSTWPGLLDSKGALIVMDKRTMFEHVKEFHIASNLDVAHAPIDMKQLHPHGPESSSPLWRLRMSLVEEEFNEFKEAMQGEDLVAIADAIMDLHYVLSGTCVSFGIDEDACFEEVQRSNMSKFMPDGSAVRRGDGKILKGPNFSEPDLKPIIYPEPGA